MHFPSPLPITLHTTIPFSLLLSFSLEPSVVEHDLLLAPLPAYRRPGDFLHHAHVVCANLQTWLYTCGDPRVEMPENRSTFGKSFRGNDLRRFSRRPRGFRRDAAQRLQQSAAAALRRTKHPESEHRNAILRLQNAHSTRR